MSHPVVAADARSRTEPYEGLCAPGHPPKRPHPSRHEHRPEPGSPPRLRQSPPRPRRDHHPEPESPPRLRQDSTHRPEHPPGPRSPPRLRQGSAHRREHPGSPPRRWPVSEPSPPPRRAGKGLLTRGVGRGVEGRWRRVCRGGRRCGGVWVRWSGSCRGGGLGVVPRVPPRGWGRRRGAFPRGRSAVSRGLCRRWGLGGGAGCGVLSRRGPGLLG